MEKDMTTKIKYSRNMKGLITFDRKTKKDSYFWYKANWSEEPAHGSF